MKCSTTINTIFVLTPDVYNVVYLPKLVYSTEHNHIDKLPWPDAVVEIILCHFSLPNNKILDLSKLKIFAEDKMNVSEKLKFVFGRIGNIVGREENAGYKHFLLFPKYFQEASFSV